MNSPAPSPDVTAILARHGYQPFSARHGLHAQVAIELTPVTDPHVTAQLDQVMTAYGLPPSRYSAVNQEPYNARNFCAETSDARYCVRQGLGRRSVQTADVIPGVVEVSRQLGELSVPAPQYLWPRESKLPYVDHVDAISSQRSRFTVSNWIDASSRFSGSDRDVVAFAAALATWHFAVNEISRNPTPAISSLARFNSGLSRTITSENIDAVFHALRAAHAAAPLEITTLADSLEPTIRKALSWVQCLDSQIWNQAEQLIHGEPNPQNVLIMLDDSACLIDLETIRYSAIYDEIGYAAWLSARAGAEGKDQVAGARVWNLFLEKYFEVAAQQGDRHTRPVKRDDLTIALFAQNRVLSNWQRSWLAAMNDPSDSTIKAVLIPQLPGYALNVFEFGQILEVLSHHTPNRGSEKV